MNKFSKMILGAAVSAMVLSGCRNQEVVAPTVTNPNQFPNGVVQRRVTVSIQVTGSSENGRVEGLSGAQVIIAQNGSSSSKTVDKDGIAIFTDLQPGSFRWFVSSNGYASRNGVGNANPNDQAVIGNTGNNTNQTVGSIQGIPVVLPRVGARTAGRFLVDSDLDASTPAVALSNARVRLFYGDQVQPNLYYAVTDANGNYSFPSVLETVGTGLTATVSVDTVITGVGGDRLVVSDSRTAEIRFGSTGQNPNVTITPSGQVAILQGTVVVKPWGNFDYVTRTVTGGFENETNFTVSSSSKLSSAATVKLVFNASSLPSGFANNEFTATQKADGTYEFTNVPLDKTFKFVALQQATVQVAPNPTGNGNCFAINVPANANTTLPNINGVNGVCPDGASQSGSFSKTVVFYLEVGDQKIDINKKFLDLGNRQLIGGDNNF